MATGYYFFKMSNLLRQSDRGDYAQAIGGWRPSLALDEALFDAHAALGQVLLVQYGDVGRGRQVHLRRVVELDPARMAAQAEIGFER